jgi:dolichyl-diphosphooligosaccharide--protein glycosyltransferase
MVRLVLVLTPAMCVMAGIGTSITFQTFFDVITYTPPPPPTSENAEDEEEQEIQERAKNRGAVGVTKPVAWLVILALLSLFFFFTIHCNWVTSTAYSSPSIVLQASGHDGERIIFDDFREAYMWLQKNTALDAKILSWWDYGYQITGMGNRTVIVDNNTRNNTHIATVGLVMASNEERAYPILRQLDVDYVLVVFGGRVGYSSDDINKFLWMVRISSGTLLAYLRIVDCSID